MGIDRKADEPVIFVSWSVADIIELSEGCEDNLDMSVEEIRAALIYAARNEYHAGRDSILDSIKDAHIVLTDQKYKQISEAEFIERYRPLPNGLNDNASYDFGNGGCLYETYGAELEHIQRQSKACVWTIIEGEDSAVIASGFHFVNRLGYILTAEPLDNDTSIEVLLD